MTVPPSDLTYGVKEMEELIMHRVGKQMWRILATFLAFAAVVLGYLGWDVKEGTSRATTRLAELEARMTNLNVEFETLKSGLANERELYQEQVRKVLADMTISAGQNSQESGKLLGRLEERLREIQEREREWAASVHDARSIAQGSEPGAQTSIGLPKTSRGA
jgi:hypothetical protein